MAGGQQIDSGQGTLTYNEVLADALVGAESTGAAGTAIGSRLVPLRSKKAGSGTSSRALTGVAGTVTPGTVGWNKGPALSGQAVTGSTGTLTYGGLATISWNANTESDLAGYYVYHGTSSGIYPDRVTLGLVTTYQWSGLTGGQTHYFAVAAFDTSLNESAKSAEVSKAY